MVEGTLAKGTDCANIAGHSHLYVLSNICLASCHLVKGARALLFTATMLIHQVLQYYG
jgi:hypothetical protein